MPPGKHWCDHSNCYNVTTQIFKCIIYNYMDSWMNLAIIQSIPIIMSCMTKYWSEYYTKNYVADASCKSICSTKQSVQLHIISMYIPFVARKLYISKVPNGTRRI